MLWNYLIGNLINQSVLLLQQLKWQSRFIYVNMCVHVYLRPKYTIWRLLAKRRTKCEHIYDEYLSLQPALSRKDLLGLTLRAPFALAGLRLVCSGAHVKLFMALICFDKNFAFYFYCCYYHY